eukprot:scaffold21581_cov132-Skeletonema_marinoi.AAC.7
MKFIASVVAVVAVQSASAFVAGPQCQRTIVSSSTQQSMGLFDFFSEDARKEREARKQAEVEEQEKMQREIIARRSNPKKMEEYEAKNGNEATSGEKKRVWDYECASYQSAGALRYER